MNEPDVEIRDDSIRVPNLGTRFGDGSSSKVSISR